MISEYYSSTGEHTASDDSYYAVHHNGDYSGNVIIFDKSTGEEIEIPFAVLKATVGEYLRGNLIELFENMDPKDLVDLNAST